MPEQRQQQNRDMEIPQGQRTFRALRYRGAAGRVEFGVYGLSLFLIVAAIFTVASAVGFAGTTYSCVVNNSLMSATPTCSCNYSLMAVFVVVALIFLGVICAKMADGRLRSCGTSRAQDNECDW